MWGHVRKHATPEEVVLAGTGAGEMLRLIQRLALRERERYLIESTALSDLAVAVAPAGGRE